MKDEAPDALFILRPSSLPPPVLFNKKEEARIVSAIRSAERATSGEIRLYIEDYCFRDHPIERAAEVFQLFGMFNTKQRNAVLIYIAQESHHFAIWGDVGINEKVGVEFWEEEKMLLYEHFRRDEAADGVCKAIAMIGERLRVYFPSDDNDNENELPDEIIYG